MNRLIRHFGLSVVLVGALSMLSGTGRATSFVEKRPDVSLKYEVEHAIEKGLDWLTQNQNEDGSWSQPDYPALTALVLKAFMGAPNAKYLANKPDFVGNGYQFLLTHAQEDGGIYSSTAERPLESYNTAICLMALLLGRDPTFEPVIRKARNYLVSLQNDGGVGYNKSGHSDLSNTVIALEALYYSKYLVQDGAGGALEHTRKLDWEAAVGFISRCQNLPSHNSEGWASGDPANRGGFVYFPGESKAGEHQTSRGKTALRSYGSMSYAGLLSYIYAELDEDDPRVVAAYDWLKANYSVEENPGMGAQGLFYYFHTMAKALSSFGVETLELGDGRSVKWREELAVKLLSLQDGEQGYWVNANGRWWERDPVLVTSYAIISLEILHRGL